MASTESYTSADKRHFVYFNVSHSVGDNANNYWTDIMLVQYFIRFVYLLNDNGGGFWTLSPTTKNDMKDLPDPHKDFKALSKTAKWIRYFQIDGTLHNAHPMVANGRVEPMSDPTLAQQTIGELNGLYQAELSKMGFDWKKYAMEDAGMPQMLKTQLKRNLLETIEVG
jgi:hypothetical protein